MQYGSALGASIAKCVEIKNLSEKNDFTCTSPLCLVSLPASTDHLVPLPKGYFIYLMLCVVIENNVVMIAASIAKRMKVKLA